MDATNDLLRSYLNGVPGPTIAGGTAGNTEDTASTTVNIGQQSPRPAYFNGYIMEIIIYSRCLTLDERRQVHNYLGTKYAIVVAQQVSAWADQSGTGKDLAQSTAALRPVYYKIVQNGRPMLGFDGSATNLVTSVNVGISGEAPRSTFVVHSSNVISVLQYSFGYGAATEAYSWQVGIGTGAKQNLCIYTRTALGSTSYVTKTAYVTSQVYTNGYYDTSVWHVNNALQTIGDSDYTPNTTDAVLYVGGGRVGGSPWCGPIHEILIYDKAVSTDERIMITTYLARKWGITIA